MKNKKLFILIILLIFFGIYIFSKNKNIPKTGEPIVTPTPVFTNLTYNNTSFDFTLTLPKSWEGYTQVTKQVEYGNLVTLIHPLSTVKNERMNVPILVYPLAQWTIWEKNNFEGYPTAAPIGPTERGRNDTYVFATAPRYNFNFAVGWEEVEDIIKTLKGL